MKVEIRNETITRRFAGFAALFMVGISLAGCVVTSVYPYYTAKDLVFEPSLLGDWVDADVEPKSGEFIRVEKLGEKFHLGDKAYRATAFTADQTNTFILHLFRLNGQLLLDTRPTNSSPDRIPVHQISKVTQLPPALEMADLNYQWLEGLVKKNPKAIRHVIVRDKEEMIEDERIVLTADTPELQKFIRKHLNNPNAWKSPAKAKRRN